MYNSGRSFRNLATAIKFTKTQSATGAKKEVEQEIKTFRFCRQTYKESQARIGKEDAMTGLMIIQCRYSTTTEAMTHYRYKGDLYRIDSKIMDEADRSYTINATLVNE